MLQVHDDNDDEGCDYDDNYDDDEVTIVTTTMIGSGPVDLFQFTIINSGHAN